MSVNHEVTFNRVAITKNSLPLKKGDILERYGKRFRKIKGKYGKPVFIVVSLVEEDPQKAKLVNFIGCNTHANIINLQKRDLVVGQAV